MKKNMLLFLLFVYSFGIHSQTLVTYSDPPTSQQTLNPPVIPPMQSAGSAIPANWTVGRNNDFSVRVKSGNTWKDLFEYNTFTNSTNLDNPQLSSFVSFDFTGTVTIEVTYNLYPYTNFATSQALTIRPLSKNIVATGDPIVPNRFTFTINNPGKFSIEIKGNRDRNLQIFANAASNDAPALASCTKIYEPGLSFFNASDLNPASPSTVYIKSGAIVVGNITAKEGDVFYIEGGGVLKGGIRIEDIGNVKIYGRGIIDLSNYRKKYVHNAANPIPVDYEYFLGITIRRSHHIELNGITINDSQQLAVEITDSHNITIDNLKIFSRVLWGDGLHFKGTSDVTVRDCYIRTSDDCISIYASRHLSWDCDPAVAVCGPTYIPYQNKDALNYTVENMVLYADKAHPIEIGWHGNQNYLNAVNGPSIIGKDIYNLYFNNIDILEHDETWPDYLGAISVNCGDGNSCTNFLFKDIRVEDFTSGRLLSVKVEPALYGAAGTDGKLVSNIRFENLSYKGTGEQHSAIQGIDCNKYVDGVHFENFRVNDVLITKLSDYHDANGSMIDTNAAAYNLTFEEANNYSFDLPDGDYRIKYPVGTGYRYMQKNTTSPNYVNTAPLNTTNNNQIWHIENVPGFGHYRIRAKSDSTLIENSAIQPASASCQDRYLVLLPQAVRTGQEWKIVKGTDNLYKINNAYTRSYLTQSTETGYYALAMPKIETPGNITQKWQLELVTSSQRQALNNDLSVESSIISPNPASDYLNFSYAEDTNNVTVRITDLQGSVVCTHKLEGSSKRQYIGNLKEGIYLITLENDKGIFYSGKFIKKP